MPGSQPPPRSFFTSNPILLFPSQHAKTEGFNKTPTAIIDQPGDPKKRQGKFIKKTTGMILIHLEYYHLRHHKYTMLTKKMEPSRSVTTKAILFFCIT
jgi:hypothetical protein